MLTDIPQEWRRRVIQRLREGGAGVLVRRTTARQRWQDLFPGSFDYELCTALADALEIQVTRGRRHEMDEPGETYAFTFMHKGLLVYAKINLTHPDQEVIVYSAHRPDKEDDLT